MPSRLGICLHYKGPGRLGIKDLGTHNISLLLNLIHHLHCADSSAWANWVKQNTDIANLKGQCLGHHWDLLRSLLPLYQALTTVQLGDGRSTLLWSDVWAGDESFEERFPRLFSHCINRHCTVEQAISSNLQGSFVNRLSPQAHEELSLVQDILQRTMLTDQPDVRTSPFARTRDKLDTSAIYRLLKAKGQQNDPTSAFIWKNAAPTRVQMFMWLLLKGRTQCSANLYRKNILASPACLACGANEETTDHLIFQCPMAVLFWETIGLQQVATNRTMNLHCIPKVRSVPDDQYSAFIALCCWQIWKRRNALVFRQENQNLRQLLISCKAAADPWRARMPKKSKKVIDAWSNIFDAAVISLTDVT